MCLATSINLNWSAGFLPSTDGIIRSFGSGHQEGKSNTFAGKKHSVWPGVYIETPLIIVGMSQSFTFEKIEVQFSLLAQNWPLNYLSLMLPAPFCSGGFGVGFGYLNTEPHRIFGALGYKSSGYRYLGWSCVQTVGKLLVCLAHLESDGNRHPLPWFILSHLLGVVPLYHGQSIATSAKVILSCGEQ